MDSFVNPGVFLADIFCHKGAKALSIISNNCFAEI